MAIKAISHKRDCAYSLRVDCANIFSKSDVAATLSEISTAYDMLEQAFNDDEKDFYFYYLELVTPEGAAFHFKSNHSYQYIEHCMQNHESCDPNQSNPWKALGAEFWLAAYSMPELRPWVVQRVNQVENILWNNDNSDEPCSAINEFDEVQLGEPLVTLLALHDEECVPLYARFMKRWDLDHAVYQAEVVALLIQKIRDYTCH